MRLKQEDLHRLHDGELAGSPAPADLDGEDLARLQAIGDVGAAIRNTLASEAADIDVWAGVEKRLGQPSAITFRRRLRRSARFALPAVFAVAAAVVLYFGMGRGEATNACDVEELDIAGASATVFRIPDSTGTTTVIWTTED